MGSGRRFECIFLEIHLLVCELCEGVSMCVECVHMILQLYPIASPEMVCL